MEPTLGPYTKHHISEMYVVNKDHNIYIYRICFI